jgi:aminopeptidase-like protein
LDPIPDILLQRDWGFCLEDNQLKELIDEEYEVCIDSSLEPGFLTYGECFLPGDVSAEVLISCHVCHPSLAKDNLSGIGGVVGQTSQRRQV